MIEHNPFLILFGIFLLLTCRDVLSGNSVEHDVHEHVDLGKTQTYSTMTPSIKIEYCQSCGYRQAFEEVSKLIQHEYPGVRVEGSIHGPGFVKGTLVNFVFLSKYSSILMLCMDFNPFNYLHMQTPAIWDTMVRNKMPASMGIFLIGNMLEGSMSSTGAFEIYYNDIPMWSKIQAGRMPTAAEIHQMMRSQVSMGQESIKGKFKSI